MLSERPAAGQEPRRLVNAMTIDVEESFQVTAFESVIDRSRWHTFESRVERNTERVLGLFDQAGVKATFFVLGWIAERCPRLVRRIAAEGHEVASHGHGHQRLYRLSPSAFRQDLQRAQQVLEDVTGRPIVGYRAPSYSITADSLWALDVLIDAGYRYDASIFPISHDLYGMPSSPRHPFRVERAAGALWEIPASTVRRGGVNLPVGGGGYFRLLPYRWTRWGINALNHGEGRPAVFYLHPWEIDAEQPRLQAPLRSRFRHYTGLARTERRLRRLLAEFRFAPITTAFASLLGDAADSATLAGCATATAGGR